MASSSSFRKRIEQCGIHSDRILHLPESERQPFPWCDFGRELESASGGDFVLYLPVATRRVQDSAALATAMIAASALGKPLLICESIGSAYPWASERTHRFILESAAERCASAKGYVFAPIGKDPCMQPDRIVNYIPDVECLPELAYAMPVPEPSPAIANSGVHPALVARAAVVVSDWNPSFVYPSMAFALRSLSGRHSVPFLLVDDCGLVPLARWKKAEAAARWIRPKLAPWISCAVKEHDAIEGICRSFNDWMTELPAGLGPGARYGRLVGEYGFALDDSELDAVIRSSGVSRCVGAAILNGGENRATSLLDVFLKQRLSQYGSDRSHPDLHGTSLMSAYLHFGMIHPRSIVSRVFADAAEANLEALHAKAPSSATYLDELCTWRELGLNMAHFAFARGIALGSIELVPDWARKTLAQHLPAADEKVSLADLENERSPDPVWNAAQRELRETGLVHNYMRMLWGKGIVRWSASVQEALQRMEYLNNKYALDGRDPNSYTNFHWCLGKFDRPWPPAKPPFGLVRSMSTKAAQRKLRMQGYLQRWTAPQGEQHGEGPEARREEVKTKGQSSKGRGKEN